MRSALCDVLGVDVPIVLAPFGPWDEVELAAAVCDAGALGSVGTAVRSVEELQAQWRQLRERTDRPFAINHTGRPFNAAAFEATLAFGPTAISFHMGLPADLIAAAHDHGIRWIQTVGDVETASAAIDAGADVLVAQGTEAGGNAGGCRRWCSSRPSSTSPVRCRWSPQGASARSRHRRRVRPRRPRRQPGTRFLASTEMTIDQHWKDRIVAAGASDAVKVPHSERVMPPFTLPQLGPAFAPRALRTDLIDRLETDPDSVDPAEVGPQLLAAVRAGGGHDLLPFAGQSVALIHDIAPAGQLVDRLINEASMHSGRQPA